MAIPFMITQEQTNQNKWTDSHAGPPLNLDWIWAARHQTPSVKTWVPNAHLRPLE